MRPGDSRRRDRGCPRRAPPAAIFSPGAACSRNDAARNPRGSAEDQLPSPRGGQAGSFPLPSDTSSGRIPSSTRAPADFPRSSPSLQKKSDWMRISSQRTRAASPSQPFSSMEAWRFPALRRFGRTSASWTKPISFSFLPCRRPKNRRKRRASPRRSSRILLSFRFQSCCAPVEMDSIVLQWNARPHRAFTSNI